MRERSSIFRKDPLDLWKEDIDLWCRIFYGDDHTGEILSFEFRNIFDEEDLSSYFSLTDIVWFGTTEFHKKWMIRAMHDTRKYEHIIDITDIIFSPIFSSNSLDTCNLILDQSLEIPILCCSSKIGDAVVKDKKKTRKKILDIFSMYHKSRSKIHSFTLRKYCICTDGSQSFNRIF